MPLYYPPTSNSPGSATIYSTEIDFGTTAVGSKTFTITNGSVTTASLLIVQQSGMAATNKEADENEMDFLELSAMPQNGSFVLFANANPGPVQNKFIVNYQIG